MSTAKYLITGGCGYLGSQLLADLARDERFASSTIRVLDNMERGSHAALAGLDPLARLEFLEADILDLATLRLALHGVDCVLHLAGLVTTPVSFGQDRSMEQINHWGTANLVAACLELKTPRLLYSSSTAVYGPGGPHDEDSVCRPVGTYARSVLAAEHSVLAARERGLDARALRLGTVYGYSGFMRFDDVTNRLALLAGTGKPVTIFGSGEQRRPVLHLNDASVFFRRALLGDASAPIVNLLESNPSILEIAEVLRSLRPGINVRYTEQDVLSHLSFVSRAARMESIGWKPAWSLQKGLSDIVRRFEGVRPVAMTSPATE